MKRQPGWTIAVVVYVIYNAIIFATWGAVGADYTDMTGADAIGRSIVLPLALGAVFLATVLSLLGWWRPVMLESRRGRPGWALWVVVLIMIGFIGVNLTSTGWSAIGMGHLALLVVAGVLVGFNEESLARGVLVVGWRGSTQSEALVWFWSTLLFGLMHLPNAFFGLPWFAAVAQVGFAFLAGCGFFVIRRLSGSLILPMALHGAWDFATFSHGASGAEAPSIRTVFQFGTYLASLLLVIVVLRAERRPEE